jgi:hypothetical protein
MMKEVRMSLLKEKALFRLAFAAVLGGAIVLGLGACNANEPAGTPEAQKPAAAAPELVDTASVAEVLGKADAENSGVFDVVRGDTEYWIVYHFYTPEAKDIDDDIGIDIAPKIQALYQKFKSLDRVHFVVDVFHAGLSVDWAPYCSFVTTRKIIDETDWTNFLAADFFKAVLELNHVE